MRIDVHQHIWPPKLCAALAARRELPFIETGTRLSTVHCDGELPWMIDLAGESATARAAQLDADGLDLAVVAISSPIGIEALPREEARPLIDAHLDGVAALGPRFAAWGPLPGDRPDPIDVAALADRGVVGISIAAGALARPSRLDDLGPALAAVADRELLLFVHPGRTAGDAVIHPCLDEPLWWPALTGYVAQMQAAWLSWMSRGVHDHPRLRVIFAMLAGLAPLQADRLLTRGGPPVALDHPGVFYDTSSYGPAAIAAIASLTGADRLLYGSDRPVLEPIRTGRDLALQRNAGRLLEPALAAIHPSSPTRLAA